MQWIFGLVLIVAGITLVIAGARGTGANLLSSLTGYSPKSSTSSTNAQPSGIVVTPGSIANAGSTLTPVPALV